MDTDYYNQKTSLYRHFNKDGELLYVGISNNHINRLNQHKSASSWFEDISRVEIEHFETRGEALNAETKAIQEEKPKHNIAKRARNTRVSQEPDVDLEIYTSSVGDELIKATVNIAYLYRTDELKKFGLKKNHAEKLIDNGVLGHIKETFYWNREKRVRHLVSGWQILQYLEDIHVTGEIPHV